MSKHELIEAILQHNRTATTEFLDRFQESELKEYLERVAHADDEKAPFTALPSSAAATA